LQQNLFINDLEKLLEADYLLVIIEKMISFEPMPVGKI